MQNNIKHWFTLALAVLLFGCASFENNAYRTVVVVSNTVEAARQEWVRYVKTGKATEQQKEEVAFFYAQYQKSMRTARRAQETYAAMKDARNLSEALDAATKGALAVLDAIKIWLPPEQAKKVKGL